VMALGTADAAAVTATMHSMPVTDMYNDAVAIRADGRVLHKMYLAQVKAPIQSTYRDDVYKILASTPGSEAFRPLGDGGCPLVKG
jgi:branched-chain amino acid transport system substrate-binding protein